MTEPRRTCHQERLPSQPKRLLSLGQRLLNQSSVKSYETVHFRICSIFSIETLLKTIENSEYQSGRCPPNLGITMLT